ncbi:MAG: RagB/SusD family nutrient uptake outer membrane protein [Dysgonamonadaceae bacterium]|jgi:hypothetical protein|nr:RagB/SusD family nutrient uptake outer membrane protein [Dysgonamonadaceae bacterium]
MIKKISLFILSVVSFAVTSSCDGFLDKMPSKSTSQVITSASQLDAVLETFTAFYQVTNNESVAGHDDFGLTLELYNARPASFTFLPIIYAGFWDTQYLPLDTRASAWTAEYGKIFRANLVLNNLGKVTGTEAEKSELRAEAHLVRAVSYLELAHTYTLPYTEETKDELGLALKQSTSFEELSERSNLADTYALIESDIEEALKIKAHLLKDGRVRHWRGNIGAANAYAARYWLGRNDYVKAQQYAEAALSEYNQLLDYNTDMYYSTVSRSPIKIYPDPAQPDYFENFDVLYPYTYDNQTNFIDMIGWPEFYYFRLHYYGSWWYVPSPELVAIYDQQFDLRFKYHFVEGYSYDSPALMTNPAHFWYGYIFFFKDRIPAGPTVAEMLLTKAEAQARQGDINGAVATVNILRAKRFDNAAPANIVNLTASSREDAVKKILEERRREMPFYIRRFDIRRFNTNDDAFDDEALSKTFYPFDGTAIQSGSPPVNYTLNKGDRKWASPIPNTEIISSQGNIQQNQY